MRLEIKNHKDKLIHMLYQYLSDILLDKQADIFINGDRSMGTVDKIVLETGKSDKIIITINNKVISFPITDTTKAEFGTELITFMTKNHTTAIEFE